MKPLVDMHVHLGRSRDGGWATWKRLETTYQDLPFSHLVLFPIDEPDPGPSYRRTNARVAAVAARHRHVLPFCRLNPNEKAAYDELARNARKGFRGVKLHPRSDHFTATVARDLLGEVEKHGMPVMLHTSHEDHCRPSAWEGIFLRYKKISFILGHSGKDTYREAAEIALRCRNVYLDTSTLSWFRTDYLVRKAGAKKVVFGSDMPYSHPRLEMMKYEIILARNQKAWDTIFSENPLRIFGGL